MCANYQPPAAQTVRDKFNALPVEFLFKPETYPGYDAPVLLASDAAPDELVPVRAMFGLVPHWAKDTKISRQTYNARSETIAKLNSYRTPWKKPPVLLGAGECFLRTELRAGQASAVGHKAAR